MKPFYLKRFLIECHSSEVRDRILGATPVPIAGTFLTLRPWTRLVHADASSMKFKVAIELEGIPPHAWAEDTAAKILAPSCWLHTIDLQSASKADLSAYKLSAWTCDPRAIPKVVWLHITENEVVHVWHASANLRQPPTVFQAERRDGVGPRPPPPRDGLRPGQPVSAGVRRRGQRP